MRLPVFDIVLLAVCVAALVWAYRRVISYGRSRQAPAALLAVGSLAALCGLANGLLGGAHLMAVFGRALQGKGALGAPAFRYDFAFRSLVLVGMAVSIPGFLCLSQARGLVRGEASAAKIAFGLSLWLLAVNALLWRAFAPLLALLALVNLIGLLATRKRFQ